MSIERRSHGVVVIRPSGELDRIAIRALGEALTPDDLTWRHVILDLERVRSVDAAGYQALLEIERRGRSRHLSYSLARVPPSIATMIQFSGLETVLPIFATVEEAEARRPGGG